MPAAVETISKITNINPIKFVLDKLKGLIVKKALNLLDENLTIDPFRALNNTREALKVASDEIFKAENEVIAMSSKLKEFEKIKRQSSNTDMNTFMKNASWCDSLLRHHQLLGMINDCEEIEKKIIPKLHDRRLRIVSNLKEEIGNDISKEEKSLAKALKDCNKIPSKMNAREKFQCVNRYNTIRIHLDLDNKNLAMVLKYDDQLNEEINNLDLRVAKLQKIYKKMIDKIAETDNFCIGIKKKKMSLQGFK